MNRRATLSNRLDTTKELSRRKPSFVRRTKIGNRRPIFGSPSAIQSAVLPPWDMPPHPAKTGWKPPDGMASPAIALLRPRRNGQAEEHSGADGRRWFEA